MENFLSTYRDDEGTSQMELWRAFQKRRTEEIKEEQPDLVSTLVTLHDKK